MSDNIIEYRLAVLEKENEERKVENEALKQALFDLEKAESAERQRQLVWGIGALGLVVSTLAGVIWAYRGEIFK